MATRVPSPVDRVLEYVVSEPLRATLVVGASILGLMLLIEKADQQFPGLGVLKYLVPFVPPFFITRTAKRVNQRRAEYQFIKDAKPYIFVAFPPELSVPALLQTSAEMFSDSAAQHFNTNLEVLAHAEALPKAFFFKEKDRESIALALIESFQTNYSHGSLENFPILLIPQGKTHPVPYAINSVLTMKGGRLKWQATLTKSQTQGLACD